MTLSNVKTRGKGCRPAKDSPYIPGTIADWSDDVPVDVAEALDKLRLRRYEHHIVFFADAVGTMFDETGVASAMITITASQTLTDLYETWLCDATSGDITATLPAVGSGRNAYAIKRIDSSSNTVTIAGTIDGDTNFPLSKDEVLNVTRDGTVWRVVV